MPLGTDVGLGPGHIVLDGEPAPPWKWVQHSTLFGPCLLWTNGRPSQLLFFNLTLTSIGIRRFELFRYVLSTEF